MEKIYPVELNMFKENVIYGLQKILLDNFSRNFYIWSAIMNGACMQKIKIGHQTKFLILLFSYIINPYSRALIRFRSQIVAWLQRRHSDVYLTNMRSDDEYKERLFVIIFRWSSWEGSLLFLRENFVKFSTAFKARSHKNIYPQW